MHHHKHKPRKSERPKPPVCAGCGGPHPKNGICKGCGYVSKYIPTRSMLWCRPILSDEQREEID